MVGARRGLLFAVLLPLGALAQEAATAAVTFERVWTDIRARSPAVRAFDAQAEAERVGAERGSRHWIPRVVADGRVSGTNDPAQTFFGLLAQRGVEAGDLTPDTLNEPPARVYGRLSVGADWPFYEGGAPSALVRGRRAAARQRTLEASAEELEAYASAAALYGAALVASEQAEASLRLAAAAAEVTARYELGTPESPLGYSGLLGLRALENRLGATVASAQARAAGAMESLGTLAGRADAWRPARQSFDDFVQAHLPLPEADGAPPRTRAAEEGVAVAEERIVAERARVLPVAGLFGELVFGAGSRDVAVGVTGGAYARWRLDAVDMRASEEAVAAASAARAQVAAQRERETVAADGARRELAALGETLRLLVASDRLLAEQAAVARRLFQAGAINALQLVEVQSRWADTLDRIADARFRTLEARARLVRSSAFAVPAASGGPDGR